MDLRSHGESVCTCIKWVHMHAYICTHVHVHMYLAQHYYALSIQKYCTSNTMYLPQTFAFLLYILLTCFLRKRNYLEYYHGQEMLVSKVSTVWSFGTSRELRRNLNVITSRKSNYMVVPSNDGLRTSSQFKAMGWVVHTSYLEQMVHIHWQLWQLLFWQMSCVPVKTRSA